MNKRATEKIHKHNNTFLKCFHCEKKKQFKVFFYKVTGCFASLQIKNGSRKGETTYYCPDCRTPETKLLRCITCYELKGRDQFNNVKIDIRPTGKKGNCIQCDRKISLKYLEDNRDKINAQH